MILRDPHLSRRQWLRVGASALASGWLAPLAARAAEDPKRKRACVLLYMHGGPSTIDLFDLKPGHANGGPFKEIATAAPGLKVSEYLPKLAAWGDRLAVVRSLTSKEGDHGRATYQMRSGYLPQGVIQYPAFGAAVARELVATTADLPPYVCVGPPPSTAIALGGGFLGPRFNPLALGTDRSVEVDKALAVPNLAAHPGASDRRRAALEAMNERFADGYGTDPVVASRRDSAVAAARLMRPEAASAFDLTGEKDKLRDGYGRNLFGQGCLLARRLVERGVPFVEVALDGWDTHNNNFDEVKSLSGTLDRAFAALLSDLKDRGLLDTTLIVWAGEFGRTPKINGNKGRDHWPNAFGAVLAGGGVKGGQAVGKTTANGTAVDGKPVGIPDLLATACKVLGVDHSKENLSNADRPIRVVDKVGEPLAEVIG